MKKEVEDQIEIFIEFIKQLVNDEFDYAIDYVGAEYYFLNGGCLEFAKILKNYILDSKIVINRQLNHFAICYQDHYYDVRGKIQSDDFFEVSDEYLKEYQDYYGRNRMIENCSVDVAVIQELNNCSGNYVKKLMNHIN